jgi:Spy/CpxP family protein refolding chaperone
MMYSVVHTRRLVMALAMGVVSAACNNSPAPSATAPAAPASASAAASAPAAPSAAASATSPDASAANADAEAAQDEQVADELQAHHRHHQAGFAGFVMSAVETVGIAPDQQTAIDGFRKEHRVKMKPLREANRAVLQLLADGTAAGSIDKAKVDLAITQAGSAATAVQPAMQTLLDELHGVLRPEQRAALVDKVDAHFAAWKEANDRTADGSKHLRRIGRELSLTKDQLDKARASLDATKDTTKPFDAAAAEAYLKAFDGAFPADTFDAKKLPAAGPGSAGMVTWGTARMASLYEALVPVLTPDQRTTLADKLRQRAAGPESREKP